MTADLQDAVALVTDYLAYVPHKLSDVDLATAIVVTEVELEHVRKHGTVTEELQCLARLADLKLQLVRE